MAAAGFLDLRIFPQVLATGQRSSIASLRGRTGVAVLTDKGLLGQAQSLLGSLAGQFRGLQAEGWLLARLLYRGRSQYRRSTAYAALVEVQKLLRRLLDGGLDTAAKDLTACYAQLARGEGEGYPTAEALADLLHRLLVARQLADQLVFAVQQAQEGVSCDICSDAKWVAQMVEAARRATSYLQGMLGQTHFMGFALATSALAARLALILSAAQCVWARAYTLLARHANVLATLPDTPSHVARLLLLLPPHMAHTQPPSTPASLPAAQHIDDELGRPLGRPAEDDVGTRAAPQHTRGEGAGGTDRQEQAGRAHTHTARPQGGEGIAGTKQVHVGGVEEGKRRKGQSGTGAESTRHEDKEVSGDDAAEVGVHTVSSNTLKGEGGGKKKRVKGLEGRKGDCGIEGSKQHTVVAEGTARERSTGPGQGADKLTGEGLVGGSMEGEGMIEDKSTGAGKVKDKCKKITDESKKITDESKKLKDESKKDKVESKKVKDESKTVQDESKQVKDESKKVMNERTTAGKTKGEIATSGNVKDRSTTARKFKDKSKKIKNEGTPAGKMKVKDSMAPKNSQSAREPRRPTHVNFSGGQQADPPVGSKPPTKAPSFWLPTNPPAKRKAKDSGKGPAPKKAKASEMDDIFSMLD